MSSPTDWVCEECAAGFEDSCSRPEHCATSVEKRNEAAEELYDRLKEEGKIPLPSPKASEGTAPPTKTKPPQ